MEGYRGALQRGWRGTGGHYSEGGGVQRGVTARVEGYRGALQRGWRGIGGHYSEGGGAQGA